MKSNNFIITFVVLLLSGYFFLVTAQSDYAIVESFKAKSDSISSRIETADSLQQLGPVAEQIVELEQQFKAHKTLLDKSLYPHDFSRSIANLRNEFLIRQRDFITIDILQATVAELSLHVEFLNERNNELLGKIQDLEAIQNKDKKTIARLENLTTDLRASIYKRDRMVIEMVDSLMPPLMREKASLTAEDKQEIISGEEKGNVLTNVKRTINDNTTFLEVTSLKPNDLTEIKKQQGEFSKTWRYIGLKLIDVYAADEKKSGEIQTIDSLFSRWYKAVDKEAWYTIREEFAENGIQLQSFTDAEQFTAVVVAFINDEIKNIGVKSETESKNVYDNFADSTWFASIEPNWMPYLLDNKLITDVQKDEIENKISEWKSGIYPFNWWIYLIIALVIIGALIFIVMRRKPKSEDEVVIKE